MRIQWICFVLIACYTSAFTFACQSAKESVSKEDLIPKHLIPLLHAAEVQTELRLTPEQIESIEAHFFQNDGDWFRSRRLPAEKQNAIIDPLIVKMKEWIKANLNAEQKLRLKQIELQAQGLRILLRTDIERELKMTPQQTERLSELAKSTHTALQAATRTNPKAGADATVQARIKETQERESQAFREILTQSQQQKLLELLGKTFETSQLQRILPMAPDFVASEHWINSSPLQLNELRGKVLLIHFYAFQCHNCHANFEIYKRWHQQLSQQGVVVIGIQTPELPDERKPQSVIAAAKERGLEFPILIDLESKNWAQWGNTMWPTVYVVDKRGYLRYWWEGELNWQGATGDKTIEQMVSQLLKEE